MCIRDSLVDSAESKEVLKALQDLIYVDKVAPKPSVTSAMPSSQQMLMDGQLGKMCIRDRLYMVWFIFRK